MADAPNLDSVRAALLALLDEAFLGPPEGEAYGDFTTGPGTGWLSTLAQLPPGLASARPFGVRPSIAAHAEHVRLSLESENAAAEGREAEPDWEAAWRSAPADPQALAAVGEGLRQAYEATRRRLAEAPWRDGGDIRRALTAVVHAAYHLGAARQALRLLEAGDGADGAVHLTAFVPYDRALAGLAPERAVRAPAGAPYSPAQVLAHMAFWQDWLLAQARGEAPAFPAHAEAGWPTPDADAWPDLVTRFLAGLTEARTLARDSAVRHRALARGGTGGRVLADLAVHNAHHLGQIVLLRRLAGDWPPPGGGDTW
ncbi:MAG: DinB family protein [Firmicutes bacterium]|nr:DinB family protein [Bacillota bacterium]